MLAIGNDQQFAQFCRCAGHPEWSSDPRFATNRQRVAHREALIPMLSEVTRTRTTQQWIEALEPLGVPCGPINDVAQVFADPQAVARGLRTDISSAPGQARARYRQSAAIVCGTGPVSPATAGARRAYARSCWARSLASLRAELDELARDGAI